MNPTISLANGEVRRAGMSRNLGENKIVPVVFDVMFVQSRTSTHSMSFQTADQTRHELAVRTSNDMMVKRFDFITRDEHSFLYSRLHNET